ncbi:Pantothenate kinase 4 [Toxocara canis]|uniref:4'-phosphopantetheine phosphatase n=1 Tax=Toxocara canis TaxID=6265 RepID=A0A0B2V026_TOXCA|nr:Pantothenate kinase 4 [Toxocara canis]
MMNDIDGLEESRATIENTLRNLQNAKQFAFDIGSSLVKIAYSSSVTRTKTNYDKTMREHDASVMRLHFIQFHIKKFRECLHFIQKECGPLRVKSAVCTGSGTSQYQDVIANALGVEFHKVNEMECLVKGNNFLLNNVLDEAFTYDHHNEICKYSFETVNTKSQFPYLLVNIGTGVSIYKVESDECFERVGGSSLGGGCFFGMGSLLTQTDDFDTLMRMAEEGDHRSMDILVSDIYGGRAHKLGLPSDLIAGSFGKLKMWKLEYRFGDFIIFMANRIRTYGSLKAKVSLLADFDTLMRMAEEGDHRSMDILVSDIYGGRAHKLGLPSDLIAGSFGKCADAEYAEEVKRNSNHRSDMLRSLLLMISNSIGQIAVLYASTLCANRIYFGGYFIRNHPIVMRTMTFAVNFWSQGEIQAQFLRHEGYTSAIGAFLKGVEMFNEAHPEQSDPSYSCSWKEYYAGSTALGRFVPTAPLSSSFNVGVLEMECCEMNLSMFPLLRSDVVYRPDTVSLNDDPEAREYWISCMEGGIEKTIVKAVESQSNCSDVRDRAESVRRKYLEHLKILREKPFAYGCCNVRNLLDLREQILNQFLFDDAFLNQKRIENERALTELSEVLKEVDAIGDERDRQIRVVKGLLAGNVFDWGAKEVVKLMENGDGLTFKMATDTLQKRPWLVDDLDIWLNACFTTNYRCALIFVDNSGADVLLGVLPFARELIRRGSKQKRIENERALTELSEVLKEVDAIGDERDRQIRVVKGLLAGNVFDWGAKEVVKLMENGDGLTFKMATDTLQKRPWLVDDLDIWLNACFTTNYRCALIFVDNSGADVLLGVLPFARELIRRGSKVIIACNWSPALNDITAYEMEALMNRACERDETIGKAVIDRRIVVCNSGQGSPCLDLRRVNSSLCEMVMSEGVDLVVIEGMGRAIHTNFDAHFICDSLKAAVIKTKWLADRLGGSVFSVVCKFEHGLRWGPTSS